VFDLDATKARTASSQGQYTLISDLDASVEVNTLQLLCDMGKVDEKIVSDSGAAGEIDGSEILKTCEETYQEIFWRVLAPGEVEAFDIITVTELQKNIILKVEGERAQVEAMDESSVGECLSWGRQYATHLDYGVVLGVKNILPEELDSTLAPYSGYPSAMKEILCRSDMFEDPDQYLWGNARNEREIVWNS
jgi:hypothetical protein